MLPNVDDGAQSLDDALEMLRIAAQDGVTNQVLTPHIQTNRFDNNLQQLSKLFDLFCKEVATENIPIKLHLAAEVRIGPEIMQMVETNTLPWLGTWHGENCFLLELPPGDIPAGSINLIHWLRNRRITPIIVHPERIKGIQNTPSKLQPFLDCGCPIQITSSSMTGRFGKKAKQLATELIENGKAEIMASDCHNLKYRPPNLSDGINAARKIIGHSHAEKLAKPTALKLL